VNYHMKKSIKAHEKILLCILVAILLVVALVFSLHFVLVRNNTTSSQGDTDLEENNSTSSTEVLVSQEPEPLVQFDGTYIQAELPENWSITEYDDENGMEMVAGGVVGYNGLTGFDISNSEGKTIFQFRGVDGVGDSGRCSEIFQFSDTVQDYVTAKVNTWNSYGNGDEAKIIDLSTASYTESSLFDRTYRRIGSTFYWKNIESPEGIFNPECGMWSAYVVFQSTGTKLVGASLYETNLDLFTATIISDSIQENELITFDKVLKSIQIK